MPIKIAERLRPFSHLPGATCVLPGSDLLVQIFPAQVCLIGVKVIPLEIEGPVQGFTVELDLEKDRVVVHGQTPQGYMRYVIVQEDSAIEIHFEKFPTEKEMISIPHAVKRDEPSNERLSLGMHKSQDVEMIRRRSDLKEIFPLWLKIEGFLPEIETGAAKGGMFQLLEECSLKIEEKAKNEICRSFEKLYHAGLYSILAPRLVDTEHQGLVPESEVGLNVSPLRLIRDGAKLIRSLFFEEREESLSVLPCLPPEFHAGRYLSYKTASGDEVDIEWSKKLLKKLNVRSQREGELRLTLQPSIKTFRVRFSLQDPGKVFTAGTPLQLSPGVTLLLDRFQK